jgi:hypothetical protein
LKQCTNTIYLLFDQLYHYLKDSSKVAGILEIFLLSAVPNSLIQRVILKPMRYQTGGSVLAGKLAIERGWSINKYDINKYDINKYDMNKYDMNKYDNK